MALVAIGQIILGTYRSRLLGNPLWPEIAGAVGLVLITVLRIAGDARRLLHIASVALGVPFAAVGLWISWGIVTGAVPISMFQQLGMAGTFVAAGVLLVLSRDRGRARWIVATLFVMFVIVLEVAVTANARREAEGRDRGVYRVWH